ncbi:hypothetical protein PMAYCL1PPCAC_26931, partial [Pristionchus mayeri]
GTQVSIVPKSVFIFITFFGFSSSPVSGTVELIIEDASCGVTTLETTEDKIGGAGLFLILRSFTYLMIAIIRRTILRTMRAELVAIIIGRETTAAVSPFSLMVVALFDKTSY